MKRKIFGVFSNLDDAKYALGQIKKESWNKAELTVLVANDKSLYQRHRSEDNFEIADEHLLMGNQPLSVIWPGLYETELDGYGPIGVGSNITGENQDITNLLQAESRLLDQIHHHKVLTVVNADLELIEKLSNILKSNGAVVIEDQAKA